MSFLKHLLPAWKNILTDKSKANDAILDSIRQELETAESDAKDSALMSSLKTATGEWLDRYGNWFGLFREEGELDETYRKRIVDFVLLKRGTIPAIKGAIKYHYDEALMEIVVEEPFRNVFTLNGSHLNGVDKLLGKYYTVGVIRMTIPKNYDAEVVDIVRDFKPAGVVVHITFSGDGEEVTVVEGGSFTTSDSQSLDGGSFVYTGGGSVDGGSF